MSDLIIKGMNMPKKCTACPFYYVDFSDGETSCLATGCEVSIGEHRDKNCPLVEIPTPHGELIDRDDVIEEINRIFPCHSDEYEWAYTTVEQADTIIEAEE